MADVTPPPFQHSPGPGEGYRTASPDTDEWAERPRMDAFRRMDVRELELRAAALRLGRDTLERVLCHPLSFAD